MEASQGKITFCFSFYFLVLCVLHRNMLTFCQDLTYIDIGLLKTNGNKLRSGVASLNSQYSIDNIQKLDCHAY